MQFYVTQTQDNIHKYVNISRIRPLRISHLNINIRTSIPITPCLGLITFTGVGDQLGYLSWSLPYLRAKSCSAQLTFPSVILFRLPVAYLICLPTLTVCRLPLTPLPCVYSITCLPPASTLCLLSVYDSVSLRYPWRCYQICACLTRCTSNKAVYGSQRHWLCVTNNEHQ